MMAGHKPGTVMTCQVVRSFSFEIWRALVRVSSDLELCECCKMSVQSITFLQDQVGIYVLPCEKENNSLRSSYEEGT